jgi:hypothetical protein
VIAERGSETETPKRRLRGFFARVDCALRLRHD